MSRAEILAVIPARGGSKGIPRKNLQLLAGRPLLEYSILAARAARRITQTLVSTDDAAIARVAAAAGADVLARPAALATDDASTEAVLEHAVHSVEASGARVDLVVLLQPTSPRRPPGLVDACIERLEAAGADSLLTVCRTHAFFWRLGGSGPQASYDYRRRPRRQELREEEVWFRENGSVYVTKRDLLLTGHSRLGGRIVLYEMAEEDSFEIDSPFDLWLHERLAERSSADGWPSIPTARGEHG